MFVDILYELKHNCSFIRYNCFFLIYNVHLRFQAVKQFATDLVGESLNEGFNRLGGKMYVIYFIFSIPLLILFWLFQHAPLSSQICIINNLCTDDNLYELIISNKQSLLIVIFFPDAPKKSQPPIFIPQPKIIPNSILLQTPVQVYQRALQKTLDRHDSMTSENYAF